jgi:hypothetical protein
LAASADAVSTVCFNTCCKINKCYTATGNNSFGKCSFGCSYGIVNTELLLIDFSFGGTTNFNELKFT